MSCWVGLVGGGRMYCIAYGVGNGVGNGVLHSMCGGTYYIVCGLRAAQSSTSAVGTGG